MGTSQVKNLFHDYEGFEEKFKPKKTTDDCYTPELVYNSVLEWVKKTYNIEGRPIVRPFYPGGDFEYYDYPDNCVVVDNPPFSIYSKICRWYKAKNIDFFLFGPHLTLRIAKLDVTYIVCDATITYANGAKVNTGFVTNMDKARRIWLCPELKKAIEKADKDNLKENKKPEPPKINYPDDYTSIPLLGKIITQGVSLELMKCDVIDVSSLTNYKNTFGGGFLLNARAREEAARAREEAARAREEAARARGINVELSEAEKYLINQLNKQH